MSIEMLVLRFNLLENNEIYFEDMESFEKYCKEQNIKKQGIYI